MTAAKKPAAVAPTATAPAPVAAAPAPAEVAKTAPKTVRVKNISKKTIPLAKGYLKPGKECDMPFPEFSRLHGCLEKV